MGIAKKLMDKAIKDGKPWNYGLLQYRVTPISSTIPSPLEALTGRKPRTSLPQVPSTIGRTVDGSRICQELIKRQPRASTQHGMDLEPGQPVFVKEVQGNVWKTATVDQPAKEPYSYWVRYPRQLNPEKDPPDDQTKALTFSSGIGDAESREEQPTIQDLQHPAEFPDNTP